MGDTDLWRLHWFLPHTAQLWPRGNNSCCSWGYTHTHKHIIIHRKYTTTTVPFLRIVFVNYLENVKSTWRPSLNDFLLRWHPSFLFLTSMVCHRVTFSPARPFFTNTLKSSLTIFILCSIKLCRFQTTDHWHILLTPWWKLSEPLKKSWLVQDTFYTVRTMRRLILTLLLALVEMNMLGSRYSGLREQ